MSSADCECWSPHDHRPFCPARNPKASIRCIGTVHWEPDNRQCRVCDRFGQSCSLTRSSIGAALDDIKERGIDAHLKTLDEETPMRRRKR